MNVKHECEVISLHNWYHIANKDIKVWADIGIFSMSHKHFFFVSQVAQAWF